MFSQSDSSPRRCIATAPTAFTLERLDDSWSFSGGGRTEGGKTAYCSAVALVDPRTLLSSVGVDD